MLVKICFVQSEKRQVTGRHGIRAPTCTTQGHTAEASQHGGLDITLPVNLPREARGLAEHLLFQFSLGTPLR